MKIDPAPPILALMLFFTACSGPPLDPDRSRALLDEADRQHLAGQPAGAEVALRPLAKKHPDPAVRANARLRLAECLAAQNRTAEALEICRTLTRDDVRLRHKNVSARAEAVAGAIASRAGDDQTAREHLQRALEQGGRHVQRDAVLHQLGTTCQRLGRWKEAKRHFDMLLSLHPQSAHRTDARKRSELQHFSIQVAAFSSAPSALSHSEKLTRDGLPSFLEIRSAGGGSLYCVRIGRYPNWLAASTARDELAGQGRIGRDSFLVP